jgi:hypothetical protein
LSGSPAATAAVLAAGLLLCAATPRPAAALEVQVTTVLATEQGQSDPLLVSLAPRLRRLVGAHAYQVVNQERRRCTWHAQESFALPDGVSLHLVPRSLSDDAVIMQVRLLDGRRRLVNTNVRLRNRGTMMFGVGRDPRGDGSLIVLLKAED